METLHQKIVNTLWDQRKKFREPVLISVPILNSEDWWLIVEARCLVIIYLFISILASTWERAVNIYATRSVGNCTYPSLFCQQQIIQGQMVIKYHFG